MTKGRKSIIIWILFVVILFVVIVSLLITTSYAIYTNLSGKKGIVVVGGEDICNYSSDKLNNYPYESNLASSLDNQLYVTFENGVRTIDFTVTNTSRKGNGIANRHDIGYNIILTVQNIQGDDITSSAQVTVSKDNTQLSFGANGVSANVFYLGGGSIASHSYTVNFPEGCEDAMVVSIEARPLSENKHATMNTTLYRKFVPTATISSDYIFSCVGKFSDNNGEESNIPEQYHGFNYLITVNNGSGTVTLEWNSEYLMLDKAIFAKIGITDANVISNGNLRSVSFAVDASSVEQNYEMIFYKSAMYPIPAPTWNDMDYSGEGDSSWYVRTIGQEE